MTGKHHRRYAGRGGEKLKRALEETGIPVSGRVTADFGCNIGGFTDCMLQEGAARVYAVDTGYGMLEWKLRNDDRVIVMERTNAMHVELPEKPFLVAVDVGWTRQRHILPNALKQVVRDGHILSLFKPQYEAHPSQVRGGIVAAEDVARVLEQCLAELEEMGIRPCSVIRLPVPERKKNPEAFLHVRPRDCALKPRYQPEGPRP